MQYILETTYKTGWTNKQIVVTESELFIELTSRVMHNYPEKNVERWTVRPVYEH